jgi:hypothetical protein
VLVGIDLVTGAENEEADFLRFLDAMINFPKKVFGEDMMINALCRVLDVSIHTLQLTENVDADDANAKVQRHVMFHSNGAAAGASTCDLHLTLRAVHYEALISGGRVVQVEPNRSPC